MAEQLSKVPVNDFDSVAMKGEVLNSLTQATDEVDEDAQVKALTSVSSLHQNNKSHSCEKRKR